MPFSPALSKATPSNNKDRTPAGSFLFRERAGFIRRQKEVLVTSYFLLLLGGACQGLMVSIDGILADSLSLFEVCFFVHAIGAVVLLLYILVRGGGRVRLAGAPPYVYLVGFLGVALVVSSSFCSNRMGAALTMAVSVAGQMAASALVDHYGMFGVPVVRWSWRRLPPYLLILAGLGLMLW